LFKWVGQMSHQSCILLTSREKPEDIISLEGATFPVRSLVIKKLEDEDAHKILIDQDIASITSKSRKFEIELVRKYDGHPLALKLVSASIKELFDGSITEFLNQEIIAFDDIHTLLKAQFDRLNEWEKQIMYWLAINREYVSVQELQNDIIPEMPKSEILKALKSLVRKSLIVSDELGFTQHPVVMEYLTQQLVEEVCKEIKAEIPVLIDRYALVKTNVKTL
jgi:hypothetical protein